MISNERIQYDAETKALALERIRAYRPSMTLHNEMESGLRFNDDAYVLATLETMMTQKEFLKFPTTCIDEALEEAGRSDWWYSQEKEYDQAHDVPEYDEDWDAEEEIYGA